MRLLWIAFWAGLGILLLVAGMRMRRESRRRYEQQGPEVDDEAMRRIVEDGVLVTEEDEPLDLDEIQREERRFWEETWDEAEEF